MRNRRIGAVQFWFEHLEARAMLAGHGHATPAVSAALAHVLSSSAVQSVAHHVAGALSSAAAHDEAFEGVGSAHCGHDDGTTLTGTFTDSTTGESATLTFRSETYDGETESKLTVKVTGATANSEVAVSVDDGTGNGSTTLGTVQTDANGAGTAVFSTNPTGTEQTLPSTVSITTSAVFTVDSLTGSLAARSEDSGVTSATVRTASLTATDSTATAKAKYVTVTHDDGTTSTNLVVKVKGAEAGATLDVLVDGTSVGSLTANASGNGRAVFTDVTATDNSSITVGTLTGNLSTATTLAGHHFWHF